MSARPIKRTNARLALSMAQKTNLNRMVASASLRHPAGEVTDRLERLTGEFRAKLKQLGFRPTKEDEDRSHGSPSFSNALNKQWDELSLAECKKRWTGVGKADRLLREFCVKVAQSWTSATGRPLPVLDAAVLKKRDMGYRPNLRVFVMQNPLWLVLDAAGLKLGAESVKVLTTYARREVRERSGGPRARRCAPDRNLSKAVGPKRKKSAAIQRSN